MTTVLFGPLGVIPALLNTRRESRAGRPTSRYWNAFWVSVLGTAVAYVAVIGFVLIADNSSNSNSTPVAATKSSSIESIPVEPVAPPSSPAPAPKPLSTAGLLSLARKDAVIFASYDYRHLKTDFEHVLAILTPDFRKEYATTIKALNGKLVQEHAVSVASALGAQLQSRTADKAVIIVALNQTVSNLSRGTRVEHTQLLMSLLRQSNGSWLLSTIALQ